MLFSFIINTLYISHSNTHREDDWYEPLRRTLGRTLNLHENTVVHDTTWRNKPTSNSSRATVSLKLAAPLKVNQFSQLACLCAQLPLHRALLSTLAVLSRSATPPPTSAISSAPGPCFYPHLPKPTWTHQMSPDCFLLTSVAPPIHTPVHTSPSPCRPISLSSFKPALCQVVRLSVLGYVPLSF